jgi:drug/metabolite transporter (DMT)-like permease
MENKLIYNIIIANILWGFIPVVISGLFDEVSVITIIFFRFFVCGIVFLAIALFLILLNNRNPSKEPIPLNIFKELFRKNREFYNQKFITYFIILGFFGIILQIIFYFLALKLTSIAFVLIGFIIANIVIAFYEHSRTEELSFFKLLYLTTLAFSIGIIIFVKAQESSNFSISGLVYMLLFSACITLFHTFVNRDGYSKKEIKIINKNQYYKLIRLFSKLSIMFLTGIGLMFVFIFILNLIPIQTDLTVEIGKFYTEISDISILFRGEMLFLNTLGTIAPYIIIFIACVYWNPYNLTYNQWSSILVVIEPTTALFFGVFLINEFFPLEFLIITLFLLSLSILLRYVHESSVKVNAFLLLDQNKGSMNKLPLKLLKFSGIKQIDVLVGSHDLLLTIKKNSIKDFYYLIEQLKNIKEVKSIKILYINKINKV